MEVSRLARAAVVHQDGELFDFEVAALHDLVAWGRELAEHREVAKETALLAELSARLTEIYERVANAWPVANHCPIDPATEDEPLKLVPGPLTPEQEATVKSAEEELTALSERHREYLPPAVELVVHGPYVRAKGGPEHVAQYMIDQHAKKTGSPGGSTVGKLRKLVSGHYVQRVAEDPFPAVAEPDDAPLALLAWTWRLVYRYRGGERPDVDPEVRSELKRVLMPFEDAVRMLEENGQDAAGVRETIRLLRKRVL